MKKEELERLPLAVHRWLSFQRLCEREMLFSESYLSQPISEFVAAHHSGSIDPERNHPAFTKLGAGRPKQVDFALLTRDADAVEVVIEAKWVRGRPYPKQPIIDDLLRLECFREPSRHVRRYFLIGGLTENIKNNFFGLRYHHKGVNKLFLKELLAKTLRQNETLVSVINSDDSIKMYYKSFQGNYGVEIPKYFKTALVGSKIADGLSVFMWQIESVRTRPTFMIE